jgi:hypothetical protein
MRWAETKGPRKNDVAFCGEHRNTAPGLWMPLVKGIENGVDVKHATAPGPTAHILQSSPEPGIHRKIGI